MSLKPHNTSKPRIIESVIHPWELGCKVVLFDLDGTLLDSERVNAMVVQRMYREVLKRDPNPEELDHSRTLSTEDILAKLAPDDMEFFMNIWPKYYIEYSHLLSLYPGIPELLFSLKSRGIKIGVVTLQNRAEIAATRNLVDLDQFVNTWVAVDDAPHPKPHSAPVRKALTDLDAAPGQAIIIGDSVTDILAGQRAGVYTGAALWGAFQPDLLLRQNPDYIFNKPQEVEQLCLKKVKDL